MSSSKSDSPPATNLIIPLFGTSSSDNHALLDRLLRADPSHVQETITENGLRGLRYTHEHGRVYHLLNLGDAMPSGSTASIPVVAIMFVVDVSQYDQPAPIPHPGAATLLQSSLGQFNSIANSPQYATTPVILLFSKADGFTEKLPSSPLENWFPELKETRDPWMLDPRASDAMMVVGNVFVGSRPGMMDNVYMHFIMPMTEGKERVELDFIMAAIEDIRSREGMEEDLEKGDVIGKDV